VGRLRSGVDRLERELAQQRSEVARLRADLRAAEEALITIESGLKAEYTRADAVSEQADVRVLVGRAASAAPWGASQAGEARAKLEEADRHIRDGNLGSAIFFISRARRIAEALLEEARQRATAPKLLWVKGSRVKVRSGPSTAHTVLEVLNPRTRVTVEQRRREWVRVRTPRGGLGWIHASLLEARR
jgi:hypothetical protein